MQGCFPDRRSYETGVNTCNEEDGQSYILCLSRARDVRIGTTAGASSLEGTLAIADSPSNA